MREYILKRDGLYLDSEGDWIDSVDDALVVATEYPGALEYALDVKAILAPIVNDNAVIYIQGEKDSTTLDDFLDDQENFNEGTVEEVFFEIWQKHDEVTQEQVLTLLENCKKRAIKNGLDG